MFLCHVCLKTASIKKGTCHCGNERTLMTIESETMVEFRVSQRFNKELMGFVLRGFFGSIALAVMVGLIFVNNPYFFVRSNASGVPTFRGTLFFEFIAISFLLYLFFMAKPQKPEDSMVLKLQYIGCSIK